MAEDSWPSPNHNSRNVTDSEYEAIAARFSDDGVEGDPTGLPVVVAGAGLQVLVKANRSAAVRGFAWASGTSDVPLTIASNSSGATRVDWVVLRLDRSTWNVRAVVKQGTPGAGSPGLTQNTGGTGVFEIGLALVTVPNGATSVTVTPWTTYIGTRIRPANSGRAPAFPRLGEMQYRPDLGAWHGWNGNTWKTIYEDTGEITITGWFDTWEAEADCIGRRVGDTVGLRMSVRRIGSSFSANDADGSKIGVVPERLRPLNRYQYTTGIFTSGAVARVEVRTDGEIWVRYPTATVSTGRVLSFTLTYLQH